MSQKRQAPTTFGQSHVDDTAILAGAAANDAAAKKEVQVSTSDRHQQFCASCYRNWRRMEHTSDRVHRRIRQADNDCNKWTDGDTIPVSENLHCHAMGYCGLLSEQIFWRLVEPFQQYNLSKIFNFHAWGFVLMGLKKIIININCRQRMRSYGNHFVFKWRCVDDGKQQSQDGSMWNAALYGGIYCLLAY